MHTPETRQKFIELRAAANSIPKIASWLCVAQSTLRVWEKEDALEIARLRCSYWEDAEDKVGITIEDRLRRMAEWIKGAEDELEKRHFDLMNNRDLMRFLREARREYFRLRAMLFNAPGARASSPAATTAKPKTTKLIPTPQTEPIADELPPINTPLQREPEQPHDPPTASAVSPSESATDKIGELADFPETQPRNTNDLQQSKSSSADFSEPLALVDDEVTSQVTSSSAPAHSEPSSAYAASNCSSIRPPSVAESSDTITANNRPHALPSPGGEGQGEGDSILPNDAASTALSVLRRPSIPKSSNPFSYYSPEGLFVPSTPFNSGEPIRLFLARCREADLAALRESTREFPPGDTNAPPPPSHYLSGAGASALTTQAI